MTRTPLERVRLAAVSSALLLGAAVLSACSSDSPEGSAEARLAGSLDAGPASYVGRVPCARCHEEEHRRWLGSHHDLAMQPADQTTVLGNFDDASITHDGVTSSFFRRDGRYFVRTEGPEGELADYAIAYTFGVEPLQQYMVEFPNGRIQVLGLCWDTRPEAEGGQRWFHVYPDEHIPPGDELHWTGPNQNWNYMCAECHSTNLHKGYDLGHDRYDTTWSEIDVSCEACHGPGSRHVAWAEAVERGERPVDEDRGLDVRLENSGTVQWVMDPETGIAERDSPRDSHAELETCARCHSRRAVIDDDYVHGQPLLQTHRLALLDSDLYHADGQILGEVYVYGSFLQSKMFGAGVTCSDCHDPHGLELRSPGNAVCATCHAANRFDTAEHHFHKIGSRGSACVDCHMPTTNYMVVDPRLDHSLRVPRPDLSMELDTPNACTQCHEDRSVQWAADAVARWYGPERRSEPHFGQALQAGRQGRPGAQATLDALVRRAEAPAIARASAASLLRNYPGTATAAALELALDDQDPLVRTGGLAALEVVEPRARLALALPLLDDPVRAVRVEAVRVLATVPPEVFDAQQRARLDLAVDEFLDAQRTSDDRAEAHHNIGLLLVRLGQNDRGEQAYLTALRIDPSFVADYVNLADLYRTEGRDREGETLLRRAIEIDPDNADVHHALGLLLVRGQRLEEALAELARAAELAPDHGRHAYVYAVALHSTGKTDRALAVLETAHGRNPYDRELLIGLTTIHRDAGDRAAALGYARKLLEVAPEEAGIRQLITELEGG